MATEGGEETGLVYGRRAPRSPGSGSVLGGEVDEALNAFWYRDLLIPGNDLPEYDEEWGIHINADALVEWSAGIATSMERDGVANASDLALDLCFIFGFDHCFFHHCVDAQVTLHELRCHASDTPIADLRAKYADMVEKQHRLRSTPSWWFVVEEALANAHVARAPTRLGGLREAFIRYGILPQPMDASRGPWSLWEQAAMDERAWNALSHMVWLQHLKGELDPLGVLPEVEMIIDEGGNDAGLNRLVDRIIEACEVQPVQDEGGKSFDWLTDLQGTSSLHSFGGFTLGMFRRLSVPLWFHGGNGPELQRRYDIANGEWPYGTIERLYSLFRTSGVDGESDDPFDGMDDEFELGP